MHQNSLYQHFIHIDYSGRRYSEDEKVLALSIWKISAQGYRFLRIIFPPLPDPRTLHEFLENLPLPPGLNPKVLGLLKDLASSMTDPKEKACSLLWNEVDLKEHLDYDVKLGRIVSVEDWGNRRLPNSLDMESTRTPKMAEHAPVFMLREVHSSWKIPLSYSFCYHATTSSMLKACIKQHLEAVIEAGLVPVATSCDQGASNEKAISDMLKESCELREAAGLPERKSAFMHIMPYYKLSTYFYYLQM